MDENHIVSNATLKFNSGAVTKTPRGKAIIIKPPQAGIGIILGARSAATSHLI